MTTFTSGWSGSRRVAARPSSSGMLRSISTTSLEVEPDRKERRFPPGQAAAQVLYLLICGSQVIVFWTGFLVLRRQRSP
jgi:hypothetical protein